MKQDWKGTRRNWNGCSEEGASGSEKWNGSYGQNVWDVWECEWNVIDDEKQCRQTTGRYLQQSSVYVDWSLLPLGKIRPQR